jgi:hypothetical protein
MTAKQKDMLVDSRFGVGQYCGGECRECTHGAIEGSISPTRGLPGADPWSQRKEASRQYYRIQGPHLVIEYAPQQMGGDASMHIHTRCIVTRQTTTDASRQENENSRDSSWVRGCS